MRESLGGNPSGAMKVSQASPARGAAWPRPGRLRRGGGGAHWLRPERW
jgi:hypothetical protein